MERKKRGRNVWLRGDIVLAWKHFLSLKDSLADFLDRAQKMQELKKLQGRLDHAENAIAIFQDLNARAGGAKGDKVAKMKQLIAKTGKEINETAYRYLNEVNHYQPSSL